MLLNWARAVLPPRGWRFAAVPLAVWLLVTAFGTTGVLCLQQHAREAAAERFSARVTLMRDFVVSYVADLLERERVQANAFLTDPTVSDRDFTRSVNAFGYPAAVLLDRHGRVLQVAPRQPDLVGADLTGRYAHLRTAVVDGTSAVSVVVPSAARGAPVVAFAVPFATPSGRRVFSGAVDIGRSALSSYLGTAISLSGVRVQLVDRNGAIVASNRPVDAAALTLDRHDRPLADALRARPAGRFQRGGTAWRYTSQPIAGTPWRLSAAVSEPVLFASLSGGELAGRVAVSTAGAVGLLVVAATAKARRNRRALQLSEQRLRTMYDQSRIGMLLTDPHGRLVRVNPAIEQMLGRDDLAGRPVGEVLHADDRAGRHDPDDLRLDGDRRFRHADGHVVEVSATSTYLHDQAGRTEYVATQVINVTAQRALERDRQQHLTELAEHAAQLQRANAQVHDFMAMLSHDVRNPLTSVVTFGEILLDDWDEVTEQEKRQYVHRMTAAGHRADDLVAEVLTLAQLDAGALVARPARLDVAHAVRDAVAAHAATDGKRIGVTAPDQTVGLADPAHLQLIIGNLLGNAIKYGAPPVEVTVINEEEAIRVEVADAGEGVPAAFVPDLFGRFTRAGSGIATVKTGTGLGLYLAAQLADAGGLRLGYTPNEPHGARFILTIPRDARHGATAARSAVHAGPG